MRQGQNFNFGHAKFQIETHVHVCPRSSEWFESETMLSGITLYFKLRM